MENSNHFFSSAADRFKPWSVSKVKTGFECSQKFYFTYVNKPSAGDLVETDTSALDMGSAVHKYSELISTGSDKTEAKTSAFTDIPKTRANLTKISSLVKSLDSFETRLKAFKENNTVVAEESEQKLGIKKDLSPCEFFDKEVYLRGALDRYLVVEKNGGKHAIVLDIKTGKPYPINEYSLQLEAYGLLLHAKYPDLVSVQPAIYFAQSGNIEWYPTKIGKDVLKGNCSAIAAINNFSESFKEPQMNSGRHCSWCQFRAICGIS
jgi:CRISPR/Cas system-associated exonuclease Cas4 (RecB family)